ncbi:MAG: hypothetical protein V1918_08760 [Planctomycetota bacterium]
MQLLRWGLLAATVFASGAVAWARADWQKKVLPLDKNLDLRAYGRHKGDTVELELRIQKAPRACSFGRLFLQDAQGRKIFPYAIVVKETWGKAKLTISWSKTRFVNGRQVWHEEGSTSNSWSWLKKRENTVIVGEALAEEMPPPVWERLESPSPERGPRMILVTFKLPPEERDNIEAWIACVEIAKVEKQGREKVNVAVPFEFAVTYADPSFRKAVSEAPPAGEASPLPEGFAMPPEREATTGEGVSVPVAPLPPEKEEEQPEESAEDIWKEIELNRK